MNQKSWIFLFFTFLFSSILVFILQKILDKADKASGLSTDIEADKKGDEDEETKWKLIRIEVFEPPKNISLLSIAVGNGAHLLLTVIQSPSFVLLKIFLGSCTRIFGKYQFLQR